MDLLRRFSDRVEVAGLDEAYLDLSECPAPKARARQLKREMRAETGLVCSVGLAPNKLLAKIASDLEKPDGLCVLEPEQHARGRRRAPRDPDPGRRAAHGRAAGRSSAFGRWPSWRRPTPRRWSGPSAPGWAASFGDRARGHDDRAVVTERERKSESRETTFPSDVSDRAIARAAPSTASPTRSAAGSPRAATRAAR